MRNAGRNLSCRICENTDASLSTNKELHPYDFIQLYGYHPDHVKQEEQPDTEYLGDTIGTSYEKYFQTDDKLCKSCGETFTAKRSTKVFCSPKCREFNARQKTKAQAFSPIARRTNMEYWNRINYAMELYLNCKPSDRDDWIQNYIDNPTTKRIVCNPTLLKSNSNNIAKVCHHYVSRMFGVSIKDYYPDKA